jgi:N-acetylglucosaminyl-diphospho-decaprenol L-rhamnosyltransferase
LTTAVVVTYESARWVRSCLEALAGTSTFVVDNASRDETASIVPSEFPEARLLRRSRNDGFASAVDDALRAVDDDILLVNPDVVVDREGIENLERYLAANPRVAVVVPALRYPDGTLQESARAFPNPLALLARRSPFGRTRLGRQLLDRYLLGAASLRGPRPIDWAIGAVMLVRRDAIRQVGGMDRRFFLYGEDVDWCLRMWDRGWEVHIQPAVSFVHAYERSSRRTLDLRSAATRHHWASLAKLYAKHPRLLLGRGPAAARQAIARWRQDAVTG